MDVALMGLRLRKYTELRENWATENYSGPSANIPKLTISCWKVCNGPWNLPEAWYNKGCIHYLAKILWLVSATNWVVRLHTVGEVWYLRLPCFCWIQNLHYSLLPNSRCSLTSYMNHTTTLNTHICDEVFTCACCYFFVVYWHWSVTLVAFYLNVMIHK